MSLLHLNIIIISHFSLRITISLSLSLSCFFFLSQLHFADYNIRNQFCKKSNGLQQKKGKKCVYVALVEFDHLIDRVIFLLFFLDLISAHKTSIQSKISNENNLCAFWSRNSFSFKRKIWKKKTKIFVQCEIEIVRHTAK